MEQQYKDMGLETFYKVVDQVIDDLEAGRMKGEKVTPRHKPKTIEDTIIKGDPTELGEGEMDNLEVIGRPGKRLVVVTPEDPNEKPIIYGSPSVAARKVGLTPTTIKNRCDHNKVDAKGNTWSYKEIEE